MKQIYTITMPEDKNYLSEIMTELPTGIFNKKITATGATTLAMENKQNIILLCPNIGLIDNKIAQYPNDRCNYEFLKIDKDVTTSDVIKYINRIKGKQPVKLIATYDALQKVLGITNIYKDYALIVDEYHELLDMKSERELRAIKVLTEFSKFKKYTFLSATPINEDFLPSMLEEIPYTELIIEHSEKIKVLGQQTNKPFSMVVDIIKNFKVKNEFVINGKSCKHLYFFINSVTAVASIIKSSGLQQQDVNIFCGDYKYNDTKLEKVGCEIGELLTEKQLQANPDSEKPIHFITSKGFKGIDLYSNDGLVFYAVNCNLKSTYSGMDTLQQVSGRIRTKTNPFNGLIYHIYNTNNASLTYEEYLQAQQIDINESLEIINGWNAVPQAYRNKIIKGLENTDIFGEVVYYYYDNETEMIYLNELRIKSDRSRHKVENLIYKTGIEVKKAYARQGFEDSSYDYYLAMESSFKSIVLHKTFKEYCNAYNESLTGFNMVEPLFGCPDVTKKFIIKAFAEIGFKRIQELKYHQGSITNHLKVATSFNSYGIAKAISQYFNVNGRYSNSEIKATIQSIYDKLKVPKKATAKSISEWYEVKECKMPDRTNGLHLVSKLYSITDLKVA